MAPTKPKPPKPPRRRVKANPKKAGRKQRNPELVRRVLELAARTSPEEAHEILERENPRPPGARENPLAPSSRQIRAWQHGAHGQAPVIAEVRAAIVAPPRPALPPPADLGPPTEKDRQVDALIGKSRTWQRVKEALARALAKHPAAARDVAAELRSLTL
jgi:hypothetical protein